MTFGFAVAVAVASLLGGALQALTYPIWYRWSSAEIGSWHADTLGRALLFVPAGAVALLAGVHLPGRSRRLRPARHEPARRRRTRRRGRRRSRARRDGGRSRSTPASRRRSPRS